MYGIDDLWQADLVEMDSGNLKGISKINKGYKYMITIIDVFSKFAWAVPLKNKTGKDVTNAFKFVDRIPKNLQTDKGKEFYNKDFKELMKKYNINHYSTYTNVKASVVERFNRTLKEKMWKQFSIQGNYKWIDILPKLIDNYNNTYHTTIKMKPVEVNISNQDIIYNDVFAVSKKEHKRPKYKVGDKVRISKIKGIFEKGYTANWSTEIFTVDKVYKGNPPYYHLKDSNEEEIKGIFYEQEMQKTKYPDIYLVEKVLRKKGDKVYVKWLGFDSSHNSWIPKKNVEVSLY